MKTKFNINDSVCGIVNNGNDNILELRFGKIEGININEAGCNFYVTNINCSSHHKESNTFLCSQGMWKELKEIIRKYLEDANK